ncbi:MAG: FkbM family methyltransferase [Acidimicrobiales bacterium]
MANRGAAPRASFDDVDSCYWLLLGRDPDPEGRGLYRSYVESGILREELVNLFVGSPEFRERLVSTLGWTESAPEPVRVGKLTYYVSADDTAIGLALRRSGEYEPELTALVKRHLREGQRFVDVGAAFGYFATLAGTIVGPTGSVAAFEPGPQNRSLLLLNLAMNGVTASEVHQLALSDTPALYLYSSSGANGFLTPFRNKPEELATHALVQAVRLDDVIGPRPVDMMKIDVEGAEGLVLKGAVETLERCHPMLFCEFSPPSLVNTSGVDGPAFLENLRGYGYSIDIVDGRSKNLTGRTTAEVMSAFEATSSDHIDIVAWVAPA